MENKRKKVNEITMRLRLQEEIKNGDRRQVSEITRRLKLQEEFKRELDEFFGFINEDEDEIPFK